MKLVYEISSEDYEALGEYTVNHFPENQVAIASMQRTGGIVVMGFSAVLWYFTSSIFWFFAGLAVAVGWFWWWRRHVLMSTRKFMAEQAGPCAKGEHTIEIRPDVLVGKCDVLQSEVKWEGVGDLIATPKHLFLPLLDGRIYIIPKGRIVEGDIEAFVAALNKRPPN